MLVIVFIFDHCFRTHQGNRTCVATFDKAIKAIIFYDTQAFTIEEVLDLSDLLEPESKVEFFDFVNRKHEVIQSVTS